jgi:hypothetical protein
MPMADAADFPKGYASVPNEKRTGLLVKIPWVCLVPWDAGPSDDRWDTDLVAVETRALMTRAVRDLADVPSCI